MVTFSAIALQTGEEDVDIDVAPLVATSFVDRLVGYDPDAAASTGAQALLLEEVLQPTTGPTAEPTTMPPWPSDVTSQVVGSFRKAEASMSSSLSGAVSSIL